MDGKGGGSVRHDLAQHGDEDQAEGAEALMRHCPEPVERRIVEVKRRFEIRRRDVLIDRACFLLMRNMLDDRAAQQVEELTFLQQEIVKRQRLGDRPEPLRVVVGQCRDGIADELFRAQRIETIEDVVDDIIAEKEGIDEASGADIRAFGLEVGERVLWPPPASMCVVSPSSARRKTPSAASWAPTSKRSPPATAYCTRNARIQP